MSSSENRADAACSDLLAGIRRLCPVGVCRLSSAVCLPLPRATNARGAAFLAFADLGLVALDSVPAMLRVQDVHTPEPAHREVMDRALARLVKLHASLALD